MQYTSAVHKNTMYARDEHLFESPFGLSYLQHSYCCFCSALYSNTVFSFNFNCMYFLSSVDIKCNCCNFFHFIFFLFDFCTKIFRLKKWRMNRFSSVWMYCINVVKKDSCFRYKLEFIYILYRVEIPLNV